MSNNTTKDTSSNGLPIVHTNGDLTDEARAFVEKRYAESQIAFEPLIEKISQSRRITEEDLAFRVIRID